MDSEGVGGRHRPVVLVNPWCGRIAHAINVQIVGVDDSSTNQLGNVAATHPY
jgi:hypothetical protein